MNAVAIASSITLTYLEIVELTGFRQPRRQLAELHRRGFNRAFLNVAGRVVLTRAHYESIEAQRNDRDDNRPQLRSVR
jgi:uncharacterized protein DUF4224